MKTNPEITRSHRRRELGFTLIELLIVMSIMLVLMALAVPQVLNLQKRANQTSAMQTIRTIGQAETMYNSSYNGYACPLAALGGDPKAGAPSATPRRSSTPRLRPRDRSPATPSLSPAAPRSPSTTRMCTTPTR
jgi:type IV pilus assembly protein PilA